MMFQNINTKFKKLFVLFLFLHSMVNFVSSSLLPEYKKTVLSPEDVRFAKARCQSDSTADEQLKLMWSRNQFPDNDVTHCYVKCLLRKLGLIDLVGRGLDERRLINTVWETVQYDIITECLEKFSVREDLDDRCLSYYYKWMNFHIHCPKLAKFTFFEEDYENDLGIVFEELPKSKPLGVSATEYCYSISKEDNGGAETDSNTTEITLLKKHKCNLDCVFRHFHYFDGYGRLDESEILRSFDEAFMSSKNEKVVAKCTHNANMKYNGHKNCAMAYELKICLWRSTNDFQVVYHQRDVTSRQY